MKIGCVLMAAGKSDRFGENKLLKQFCEKTIIEHVLDSIPKELISSSVVVTRYDKIEKISKDRGFLCVKYSGGPVSETIRLGLSAIADDIDGCMFCVCDQPLSTMRSIKGLSDEFAKHPSDIVAACKNEDKNSRGNPVIFPKDLFEGLLSLEAEQSGGEIIRQNLDRLRCFVIKDIKEFSDVDTMEDYNNLAKVN